MERENLRIAQALIDALASHVALLDATGTIVAVNRAWRGFAEANATPGADPHHRTGVGMSYVDVCRGTTEPFSEEGATIAAGILGVLGGRVPHFELVYPCSAPGVPRWFRLRVTPLGEGGLVEHVDVTEQAMSMTMVGDQSNVLESIATGRPLSEILEQIVDLVEAQLPGALCSILQLERETRRLRFAAGRHLPHAYNQAVDGVPVEPKAGSCGTAAYLKQPVDVADIATDPLWDDYRALALSHGLRACFSFPVIANRDVAGTPPGEVLATFAIYHREPRNSPATSNPRTVGPVGLAAAHLVGVAIERHLAETALRGSEARLRAILDHSPALVFLRDAAGRFMLVNRQFVELAQIPEGRWAGKTTKELFGDRALFEPGHAHVVATREIDQREEVLVLPDGRRLTLLSVQFPLFDGRGELQGVGAISTDITSRVHAEAARDRLQEQLQQSQKLEAIGQLAGGIAHDFNNLLTIIQGNVEMLRPSLPPGDSNLELVQEIGEASERATALTRQLLTFSRKAIATPRELDLDEAVTAAARMLRRLIGEDLTLELRLHARASVRVDPGQLEQVLMNLVLNARDAMPRGGPLCIETSTVMVEEAGPTLARGPHAVLSVTDAGGGIDPAVIGRVFEPFFTTKGVGQGTGLGLATVYGIVRQAEGQVTVESELGRGSKFSVYLPIVAAAPRVADPTVSTPMRGHETILLAEDEPSVRRLSTRILEGVGYHVLVAVNGVDALKVSAAYPQTIDLLVTDVVMPELGGRALVEALRLQRPGLRVLYVSGYTDDAVVRHGIEVASEAFLVKPFTPSTLTQKVRDVLDAARA